MCPSCVGNFTWEQAQPLVSSLSRTSSVHIDEASTWICCVAGWWLSEHLKSWFFLLLLGSGHSQPACFGTSGCSSSFCLDIDTSGQGASYHKQDPFGFFDNSGHRWSTLGKKHMFVLRCNHSCLAFNTTLPLRMHCCLCFESCNNESCSRFGNSAAVLLHSFGKICGHYSDPHGYSTPDHAHCCRKTVSHADTPSIDSSGRTVTIPCSPNPPLLHIGMGHESVRANS